MSTNDSEYYIHLIAIVPPGLRRFTAILKEVLLSNSSTGNREIFSKWKRRSMQQIPILSKIKKLPQPSSATTVISKQL